MGSIMINNEMFGCDVVANPTLLPGEEPTPITEIQINGSKYSIEGGGGGIPEVGYTIFNKGEFYNQDKITLNLTNYVIENNMIKLYDGVGQINGFAINDNNLTDKFVLITTFESSNSSPYGEAGRSSKNSNVHDIIKYGTGRITYNDFTVPINGINSLQTFVQLNEGCFVTFGDATTYIKEIIAIPCNGEIIAN